MKHPPRKAGKRGKVKPRPKARALVPVSPPSTLMAYDAACRAIAEARRVDEVKDLRDKAEAIRLYAKQAGNRILEIDCAEIRVRAERKMGILLIEQKALTGLAQGRRTDLVPKKNQVEDAKPSLAELGIDKKLSARAQQLAAVPEKKFESSMKDWRVRTERDGERVTIGLAEDGAILAKAKDIRARDAAEKKDRAVAARAANTVAGGKVENLHELAASGFKAGVILADPPWRFRTWTETNDAKSARAHYDLMTIEEICALPIAACASDNCALFIWATWPTIFHTQQVIEAWGFRFSGLAWEWFKENPTTGKAAFGLGYGTRKNLEPCLLAIRGKPTLISRSERDWLVAPRREHSKKPDEQYERIEAMYGGPNLELFGRRARPGWIVWGNEVEFPDVASMPAEQKLQAEPVAA